ncbi:MAG: class I SAM-dependent methyltransferase, partial [Candidatus Hydrogenedentes bacterium]|nr:class I SAM-dependent methyltransferase [Candidatus Hydrogenedentota bacterium]
STLLQRWREMGTGWAPLLSEPVMAVALSHLEPAIRFGASVLDLGSGRGHVAAIFAERAAFVIGLDVDLDSVHHGSEKYEDVFFVAGHAEQLPLDDNSIDAVFCHSVLQYTKRAMSLAEIHRVLRPGGRFAIIENLRGNPFARCYRMWRKHGSRSPYLRHQTPLEHLDYGHIAELFQPFASVQLQVFGVVSPVLAILPGLRKSAPLSATAREQGFVRAVQKVDRELIRRSPALASAAWNAVICGSVD